MKRRSAVIALVAALGFHASVASGSEAWVWEVLQPFDLDNGIAVSRVTYVGHYSAESAVEMTCWPNVIADYYGGPATNQNAASIAGLRATIEPSGWPMRSDTLRAVLDVSSLKTYESKNDWPDTALVAATVQCILVNAAQWSGTRIGTLRIDGERQYRKYGGIFRAEKFRCGPTRRQFP